LTSYGGVESVGETPATYDGFAHSAVRKKSGEPRVALVSLPWTVLSEPSLGLAVLKAQLLSEGIEARVMHLNLLLLRYMTSGAYNQIGASWGLNEFIFSGIVDNSESQRQIKALAERCLLQTSAPSRLTFATPAELGKVLIQLRHEIAPQYLALCAEEILAYDPTMVGFTCMFDQTIAAAALASLLKAERPDLLIVFGGYALEGPPGLEVLRAFPYVDAIAIGDGEPVIGALALASVGRLSLEDIPGLRLRSNPRGFTKQKFEIEDSPVPDYSDWFKDVATLEERDRVRVITKVLPVESSRGCWYGQKSHCIFCGIDEETLKYRQKSPSTVLNMLSVMRERYGVERAFRFSDYILPQTYFRELLPRLAEMEPRYELHCELKANQNADRVQALADAGFAGVQPGIESFDSEVLRLMKKGVTGIQNVHFLKLGYTRRIQVHYNLLYGFTGERLEWYQKMVAQLPRLYHLAPPVSRTEVIVTRFAPMHETPGLFQIGAKLHHNQCYDVLFSDEFLERTGFSLDDYAYYFERYHKYDPQLKLLYQELLIVVQYWKNQLVSREVFLSYEAQKDQLLIRDARFDPLREFTLDPVQSAVYLACDHSPRSMRSLVEELAFSPIQIAECIDQLDEARLVWREGDHVFGLAVALEIVQQHSATKWIRSWTSIRI
jgi:ribosomal peptide maturation radical SAM protein 1